MESGRGKLVTMARRSGILLGAWAWLGHVNQAWWVFSGLFAVAIVVIGALEGQSASFLFVAGLGCLALAAILAVAGTALWDRHLRLRRTREAQIRVHQLTRGRVRQTGNQSLCFTVEVRNLSDQPLCLVDWRLEGTYRGAPFSETADAFDNMLISGVVRLHAHDNIEEKTIAPLGPGHVVSGYFYIVVDASIQVAEFQNLQISAEDALGRRLVGKFEGRSDDDIRYRHPPGLKSQPQFGATEK